MNRVLIFAMFLSAAGVMAGAQHVGTVRAADQFVPGATITATQGVVKVVGYTDDSGRFMLELTPGTWDVHVEGFGFLSTRREIEVSSMSDVVTVDWVLEMPRREAPAPPGAGANQPPATVAMPGMTAPAGPSAPPQAASPAPAAAAAPAVATSPAAAVPAAAPPLAAAAKEADPKKGKAKVPVLGFQSLSVTATAEGQAAKAEAGPAPEAAAEENDHTPPTESFLVSGSVSYGLEAARDEEAENRRRGFVSTQKSSGVPSIFGDGPNTVPANLPPGFNSGQPSMFGGPDGFTPGALPGVRKSMGRATPSRVAPKAAKKKQSRRLSATSFGNKRPREGLRGSAYVTGRNSVLDATPYSYAGQRIDKPSYARSNFGFSVGGPLEIPRLLSLDRTFVYFTYGGTRSRNPYNAAATLPTELERSGDFSQSYTRWATTIYDPGNQRPFPGNIIPTSRFNSAAVGLLKFIPHANLPGRVQNYQSVTSYENNTDNYGIRLNQPVSRYDRLNFNVNIQKRNGVNPQLYGFRDPTKGRGLSSSASWSHTFTPRFAGNLSWNFSRNRNDVLPYFAYKYNVANELGIEGTSDEPVTWGPPNLSFTNFGNLSDGNSSIRRDQTSVLAYGITLVRRKHNMTYGYSYRWRQINAKTYSNARGSYSFSGLMTSGFDNSKNPLAGTGYDFADFLLGYPQSSSLRFGSENTYFRARDWNWYAQDDWRIRPNLTLNMGLRYEFFAPYFEVRDRMANLDISPQWNGVAVVTPGSIGKYTGKFPRGLVEDDKNNYSPRFGFAWRPFRKKTLQVRGGYSVFFNGSVYGDFPSRLASQPPFAQSASLSTSTARPLTIQNGFAAAPQGTITNSFAIDRYYKVGYAQTFNFSVQHNLPHHLIAELGYLGTKGTGVDVQRYPNRANPGSPLTAEQRRMIGNAVGFTYQTAQGHSIFHAGQARLTRRFVKGISANVLYQFSKSIDNVSSFGGGGTVVAQNDKDLRAERGLSTFDQRHQVTAYYVLTSPVGDNGMLRNGGKLAAFLRNWTLNGGITASSGTPLTARVLGNLANSGGTGAIGTGRADASGQNIHAGNDRFFNLAAFTLPPSGRFGNAGRNTIPGPSRFALNASFGRSFRLSTDNRRAVDFRIDTGNTFNHVSYTSIYSVINSSNYGLPSATLPMRTTTITLRYRF